MSSGVRIVHNKLLGGWYVVRGPHQTPLNGKFATKAQAKEWLDTRDRKSNPENEIRELILWAENAPGLQNQFTSIIKNLERKAKKGIYEPAKAAKLWQYWVDNAVKDYNKENLTGKYSLVQNVFTMSDRKQAAAIVEQQWRDDIFRGNNPAKRKKNPKPTWEYETGAGVVVRGTLENFLEGQGTDVTYFFRRDTGELDVVSGSRLKKARRIKENPKSRNRTMAKKRRTAKQIAATKKLVAFNKMRRGKKKTAKRKVAKRKVTRKNPARKTKAQSRYYGVFKCHGKSVMFLSQPPLLTMTTAPNWKSSRSDRVLFVSKKGAYSAATRIAKLRGMSKYYIGVASADTTAAQIRAQCAGKA